MKTKNDSTINERSSRLEANIQYVAGKVQLTPDEMAAVRRAFSTKGKTAGYLKRVPPQGAFGSKNDLLANAAWNALQPNFYKWQMGNVMLLEGEAKALYEKLSAVIWPVSFDLDASQLADAGVWL